MTQKFNSIEERNAFFHQHYAEIMQRCHICVLRLCRQYAYQQYDEVMSYTMIGVFLALNKLDSSKNWLSYLYSYAYFYADQELRNIHGLKRDRTNGRSKTIKYEFISSPDVIENALDEYKSAYSSEQEMLFFKLECQALHKKLKTELQREVFETALSRAGFDFFHSKKISNALRLDSRKFMRVMRQMIDIYRELELGITKKNMKNEDSAKIKLNDI